MTTKILSVLAPKNDGYFPTHDQQYSLGSFRSVNLLTDRDAIPLARRVAGMWVKVLENDTVYEMGTGLTNGDWSIVNSTNINGAAVSSGYNAIPGSTLTVVNPDSSIFNSPSGIATDSHNNLWVCNQRIPLIYKISKETLQILETIDLTSVGVDNGFNAREIYIHNNYVFVSEMFLKFVVIIDMSTNTVVGTADVSSIGSNIKARSCIVDGYGNLWVNVLDQSNSNNSTLAKFTNYLGLGVTPTNTYSIGAHIEALNFGGGFIWGATGTYNTNNVYKINPSDGTFDFYNLSENVWTAHYAFGSVWASGLSNLYRFDPNTFPSAPIATIGPIVSPTIHSTFLTEITHDDSTIWVVDWQQYNTNARITRFSTTLGSEALIANIPLNTTSSQPTSPIFDGTSVWICDRFGTGNGSLIQVDTTLGSEAFVRYYLGPVIIKYNSLGSGYNQIQDHGSNVTQRNTINFTGSGVAVSDSGSLTTVNVTGAVSNVLVLRPGASPSGNVYNDFAVLWAARQAINGFVIIDIDGSLGGPQINPGTYDVSDTMFRGNSQDAGIFLYEGVIFEKSGGNIQGFSIENLQIFCINTSTPIITITNDSLTYNSTFPTIIAKNSWIECQSGGVFIEVSAGRAGGLSLHNSYTSASSGHIINVESGANFTVNGYGYPYFNFDPGTKVIGDNVFSGSGTITLNIDASINVSSTQPSFTGTLTTNLLDKSYQVGYSPASPGSWSPSVSQVAEALDQLKADSGGAFPTYTNVAALAAGSTTGMTRGTLAYVNTLKSYFRLETDSIATLANVVVAAGSVFWVRVPEDERKWQLQPTWYVNPGSGNDENDGFTSGTPLNSFMELRRRLNGKLFQDTIVNVMGNVLTTDPIDFELDIIFDKSIQSTRPILTFTAALTSGTAFSISNSVNGTPASNVPPSMDASTSLGTMPELIAYNVSNVYGWALYNPTGNHYITSEGVGYNSGLITPAGAGFTSGTVKTLVNFGNVKVRMTGASLTSPIGFVEESGSVGTGYVRFEFGIISDFDCDAALFQLCLFQTATINTTLNVQHGRYFMSGCCFDFKNYSFYNLEGLSVYLHWCASTTPITTSPFVVFTDSEIVLQNNTLLNTPINIDDSTATLIRNHWYTYSTSGNAFIQSYIYSYIFLNGDDGQDFTSNMAYAINASPDVHFNFADATTLPPLTGSQGLLSPESSNTDLVTYNQFRYKIAGASEDIAITWGMRVIDGSVTTYSGPRTYTLPAFPLPNETHVIVAGVNASTNLLTINGNGKNINGSSTYTISENRGIVKLFYSFQTGAWVVISKSSAPVYSTQTNWYIDPVSGNDSNVGDTSGSPIKTFKEMRNRLNGRLQVVTNVYVMSTVPSTDPIHMSLTRYWDPSISATMPRITIQGYLANMTVAHTGSVTSATSTNTASNLAASITDTGVSSWTPYVGKLIRIDSTGTTAWIMKDLGSNTARVTQWTSFGGLDTATTPTASSAYTIYDPILVQNTSDASGLSPTVFLSPPGGPGFTLGEIDPVTFDLLKFQNAVVLESSSAAYFRCHFEIGLSCLTFTNRYLLSGCYLADTGYLISAHVTINKCGANNGIWLSQSSVVEINDSIIANGGLTIDTGANCFGNKIGCFDNGTGIALNNASLKFATFPWDSSADSDSRVAYGSNNGTGMQIYGSTVIYNILPKITGSTELDIDGQTNFLPPLRASAGGSLPALSNLTTWSQLNSAPFSKKLFNVDTGTKISDFI